MEKQKIFQLPKILKTKVFKCFVNPEKVTTNFAWV